MSEHSARISWERRGGEFLSGRYSREHTWSFDGGLVVAASSSPSVVPVPWSNPANVDPEEAFVVAIASCHMLTFLSLASREGFLVDVYHDEAVGKMTKHESGISWISSVVLEPVISYSGEKRPTRADEERLHHLAHQQCFIANSIRTSVTVRGKAGV